MKTPMGPYIYVRWWDYVERGCAIGTWERRYMELFCSKIKEGDVVVDVGAYIGIFSLLASERVGDKGCVYAFEPVPRSYERLMRNLEINKVKNVKAYNLGLSDRNESLPVYIPKEIPAEASLCQSSATEFSKGTNMQKEVIKVSLKPFDQFSEEEGLNHVDVVKIDVEGAELKVLKGMKKVLKSDNLKLFVEISPQLIELMGGTVQELIKLLSDSGFKSAYSIKLKKRMSLSELMRFSQGGNFVFEKCVKIGGDS